MAKKSKSGGAVKNFIFSLIWLMFVAGLVIAFFRINNITNAIDGYKHAKLKSVEVAACLGNIIGKSTGECSLNLRTGAYATGAQRDAIQKEYGITLATDEVESKEQNQISPGNSDENPQNTSAAGSAEEKKTISLDGITPAWRKLSSTSQTKEDMIIQLESLETVEAYSKVDYKRARWEHWTAAHEQHSCWTTREEVLYNYATSNLIIKDSNNNDTGDKNSACSVQDGKWISPYNDQETIKPSNIEIDHIVSLKAASEAGGFDWGAEQKRAFANDMDNLLPISLTESKEKGSRTPSEWMPENREVWCHYSKAYVKILKKYSLKVSEADKETLKSALVGCNS